MSADSAWDAELNKQVWEERARTRGDTLLAASNDSHLKTLELRALSRLLPRRGTICEAGCGNGYNLRKLRRPDADLVGFDYSPEMVRLARTFDTNPRHQYEIGDVLSLESRDEFDCIFTDRCLINLPSYEDQATAAQNLFAAAKAGGLVVIMEQSVEKLGRVNAVRARHGIPPIEPPTFNLYCRLDQLVAVAADHGIDVRAFSVSSTYYYLSRVVNAKLKGDRAEYGDFLNRIGAALPQFGDFGTLFALVARKRP